MKQHKSVSVSKSIARAVSLVVVIVIFLGLTGCSNQIAKINEQQATLQMMVKANSLQIEDMATRLEKNQQKLNTLVESVQNKVAQVADEVEQVAGDVAAVADAQATLHDTVTSNSRQVADKISTLGQNQEKMSAGLGKAIADVKSETSKVAADVTEVTAEQARLFETVQQNNQDLTQKVAFIEQTQKDRQNTIGGMEDNINTLTANISGLGKDVLKLQELLQSNIRELVSIAEISGQKQAEFQESVTSNLQTLGDSFASLNTNQSNLQSRIEQMQNNVPDLSGMPAVLDQLSARLDESLASLKASQSNLQSRIEQMQNEAPDLRDIPAALDQLRSQLEEISRNQTSANGMGMFENSASVDSSGQTDGIK